MSIHDILALDKAPISPNIIETATELHQNTQRKRHEDFCCHFSV
jgi:hypothetical protein